MSANDENINQISDLQSQLIDTQDALQNLVFQKTMQQLEDLSQIKKTKRKIARIKTLISEVKSSENS
jgi:ribosomal protein L29